MTGFGNQILGAAGVLIRAAIKSANYVAGLTGWTITRDGDAEFNDGTFRGDLRIVGSNGAYVEISTAAAGLISFQSADIAAPYVADTAAIYATSGGGASGAGELAIQCAGYTDGVSTFSGPQIGLRSANPSGSHPKDIRFFAERTQVFSGDFKVGATVVDLIRITSGNIVIEGATITNTVDSHQFPRGEQGYATIPIVAASSATLAVVFASPFPVGTSPVVFTNLDNGAGIFARWGTRAINVTRLGFTVFVFKGDAADPAVAGPVNITVHWMASAN